MTLKDQDAFKIEFLLYSATLTKKLLQEITAKRSFVFIQTLVDHEGTLNVNVTEDIKNLSLDDALCEQADSLINLDNIKKYKLVLSKDGCSFFNAKMASLIQLLQELSYLRCLVFVEKKTLL
jgi:superfamily II DNA/RNA helicase